MKDETTENSESTPLCSLKEFPLRIFSVLSVVKFWQYAEAGKEQCGWI